MLTPICGELYFAETRELRLPTTLERLTVKRVNCGTDVQNALAGAPLLRDLTIAGNMDIPDLGEVMSRLTSLDVTNTHGGIGEIVSPSLRRLACGDTEEAWDTDLSLRSLPQLRELVVLLNDFFVTGDEDIQALGRLRDMTLLHCDYVPNDVIACMTSLTSLELLSVRFGDEPEREIFGFPESLVRLVVHANRTGIDEPRLDLSACSRLQLLDLARLSPTFEFSFASLASLRTLTLAQCSLHPEQLEAIWNVPTTLQFLTFADTCLLIDDALYPFDGKEVPPHLRGITRFVPLLPDDVSLLHDE